MACEKGIYISNLTGNKLSPPTKETYLEYQLVSQVFEFNNNMLLATAFHDSEYTIIDRRERTTRKLHREKPKGDDGADQTTLEGTTDIRPLPGYNYQSFPYCMTRSKYSINLLDTRNGTIYPLVKDRKPEFDNEFMSVVEQSDG